MNNALSTAEAAFVKHRLEAQYLERTKVSLGVGTLYNAFFFLVSFVIYKGGFATIVRPLHAVSFLINLAAIYALSHGFRKVASLTVRYLDIGSVVGFSYAAYLSRKAGLPDVVTSLGDIYTQIVTGYILMATMLRGPALFVTAGLAIVGAIPNMVLLFSGSSDLTIHAMLVVHPAIIACFVAISLKNTRDRTAHVLLEYRQMIMVAPRQIVNSVVRSSDSLDRLFAPADRFCVCICSDWRSYQTLTKALRPEAIVTALESYYSMTEKVLEESFPDGNYFSDWIADELFVVAFAGESPADRERTVREAATFAQGLLAAKRKRAAAGEPPEGIDLGVAAGIASVGIIGPTHHRKATALGEIPGKSRRLQTIAKELRQLVSKGDRVVFDAETAQYLGDLRDLKRFAISGLKVNDVTDAEVFYLDAPLAAASDLKPRAA